MGSVSVYYFSFTSSFSRQVQGISGTGSVFSSSSIYKRIASTNSVDPRYMFHQANMRVSDTSKVTLLGTNKKWSLLMAWTEAVLYEVVRL